MPPNQARTLAPSATASSVSNGKPNLVSEPLAPLPPIPDHPVGPPVVRPPLSRLALIGFIGAFIIPPAGAITGWFAHRRVLRTGKRGRTLAWASMAVGGGLTVVWLLVAMFSGLGPTSQDTAALPPGSTDSTGGRITQSAKPETGTATAQPDIPIPTLGGVTNPPTETPATGGGGSGDSSIPTEGTIVPSDNQAARSRCTVFFSTVGQLPTDHTSPAWASGITQLQQMADVAGEPMNALVNAYIAAANSQDQAATDAAFTAVTTYCTSLLR